MFHSGNGPALALRHNSVLTCVLHLLGKVIYVIVLSSAWPAAAAAQYDFTGVHQFWRIADQLLMDREPGAGAWDSLFATPGYAALEARERRRLALTNGFRHALMPSRAHQKDSVLALKNWTSRVVEHISSVASRRAALDSFAVHVETLDVLGQAIARAQLLLPAGTTRRFAPPAVAFIFFLPDGRGYPDLIVADLANILTKSNPAEFFAHEVTHYYYAQLARERRPIRPLSPAQQALVVLITKLHEESLGDQHDKIPWLSTDLGRAGPTRPDSAWLAYLAEYARHYHNGAALLRELNGALEAALAEPTAAANRIEAIASALPLEGRPVGSWISTAIRRTLGAARLGDTAGNPIDWLLTYSEAAGDATCGCPPMSPRVLQFLRAIQ